MVESNPESNPESKTIDSPLPPPGRRPSTRWSPLYSLEVGGSCSIPIDPGGSASEMQTYIYAVAARKGRRFRTSQIRGKLYVQRIA